jgi:hypothetical protein
LYHELSLVVAGSKNEIFIDQLNKMFQNTSSARRACCGTFGIVYASVSQFSSATEAFCTQKNNAEPHTQFAYVTLKDQATKK